MLVLSARPHEKIRFAHFQTSVEVVSIQPGLVRLGIDAPPEVRVVRDSVPDRVTEWGPPPEAETAPPTLLQLNQLVDRRLEIAHLGLTELRRHLQAGQEEDAATVLDKLSEDLHLLRRRLRREAEKAGPRTHVPAEADVAIPPCFNLPCHSR